MWELLFRPIGWGGMNQRDAWFSALLSTLLFMFIEGKREDYTLVVNLLAVLF